MQPNHAINVPRGVPARSQGLHLLAQAHRRPVQSELRQQRRDLQPRHQDAQARPARRRPHRGCRRQHRRDGDPRRGNAASADARLVHDQRRRGHGEKRRRPASSLVAAAGDLAAGERRATDKGAGGIASGRDGVEGAAAAEVEAFHGSAVTTWSSANDQVGMCRKSFGDCCFRGARPTGRSRSRGTGGRNRLRINGP